MSCDLCELLEQTRPPDEGLVELIEQAILDGQIDGLKVDLAYSWLQANREAFMASSESAGSSVVADN